jgi:hypothetical protein
MAAVLVCGCGTRPQTLERPAAASFSDVGLRLEFSEPVALDAVTVHSADGAAIARLSAAGERRTFELPFAWQPKTVYRVAIESRGQIAELTLRSPDTRRALNARLESPPGQDAATFGEIASCGVLVSSTGQGELAVILENPQQVASRYELSVASTEQVALSPDASEPPPDNATSTALRFAGDLQRQFEYRIITITATLAPEASTGTVSLELRYGNAAAETADQHEHLERIEVKLRRATADELARLVTCDQVVFPADRLGYPQPERLAGAIVLPNSVWATLRRWLWPTDQVRDRHAAYGQQAIELTNHGDVALNLVVRSEVRDAVTGEPLLAFAPPAFKAPRESPTSVHLLRLHGGETAPAIVPIYARPDVQPGHYVRHIEVCMLGTNEPLLVRELPLDVLRGDPLVSTVAAVGVALSALVWLALALFARPIVRRTGLEGLTTIALIAGLYFGASYTSRLAGDVLAAVTGPFYVFFAGVGNEGLTSLLWATLIVLLPRAGIILLASLVVFLMQAIFTGQFGVVDLLFVSVSIALAEIALALAGVTTGTSFTRPRAEPTTGQIARVAMALGCANAVTLFAQYCLIEVLHRLYFATWYVVSVSLMTGLLYGAIGAAIGAKFGFRLRRTAR